MATVDLGSIKFNWKNNWATSTAYAVDDVVFNNPDSYVCITAHTSHASDASLATSDSAYWNKMAAGGAVPAMPANTVKVRDANSSGTPSNKAVADTQILIGDGTGFTAAALSGDVTMTNAGVVTIANNSIDSDQYVDGSIDDVHVAAGLDAVKLADGSVTNAELQYINSLSSNAQTQITARLPLAGGTMSGETIFADQLVTRPEIKDYAETYNASSGTGTVDLDLQTGNVFQHTASGGNVTFTFSNPPATGKAGSFTLKWIQDSSDRTITWPTSVDWAGATAPTVTSGSAKVDIYVFTTFDAGTTWYGFQSGADLS